MERSLRSRVLSLPERLALSLLQRLDPETAHGLALRALRAGLAAAPGPTFSARLSTTVAGLSLPNPVGLAAGFDKNAVALPALLRVGFGFVEVGAVTPRAQPGNPRPRLFRLPEDRGIINRFGFNNEGMEAVAARLSAPRPPGIVGINLGANKDSADRAGDFARVLARLVPLVDFATVNVSSPNTERLRELQGPTALSALLRDVLATRDRLARRIPVFLKISPDLSPEEIESLADTAMAARIDGIIATNTTTTRDGLRGRHRDEAGGLSGAPLRARAEAVLGRLWRLTRGQLPLIGVGGIGSAEDAYARIRAGAAALQLYSALTREGLGLVPRIARGLDQLLERDGHASVADAVGTAHP